MQQNLIHEQCFIENCWVEQNLIKKSWVRIEFLYRILYKYREFLRWNKVSLKLKIILCWNEILYEKNIWLEQNFIGNV